MEKEAINSPNTSNKSEDESSSSASDVLLFLKYLTLMFQLTQNFTAQKFHIFSTASLSIARFSLFINIFLSIFSPFTLKLFSF